jgi:hypothetical protein
MSLTFSTMLELGTAAPEFSLPDVVSGATISLATFSDRKALLVLFLCQHCPFVRHVQEDLARLGRDYQQTAGIVGISSNDADRYEDDRPERLKEWRSVGRSLCASTANRAWRRRSRRRARPTRSVR